MRIQAFQFRKFFHGGSASLARRGPYSTAWCGAGIDPRSDRKGRARAVGRQHMARAGHVIAEHGRGMVAEENRAGRDDAAADVAGAARDHLAVFRVLIRQGHASSSVFTWMSRRCGRARAG